MFNVAHLPPSFFLTKQVGYKWGKSSFLILNAIYYKYTRQEIFFDNMEVILSDIIAHVEKNDLEGRDDELADFCRTLFFLDRIEIINLEDYEFITNVIVKRLNKRLYSYHLKNDDFHLIRGILSVANFYIEAPNKFLNFEDELNLIVDWIEKNRLTTNQGSYWINSNPNFKGKIFQSSIIGSLSVSKYLLRMTLKGNSKAELILKDAIAFVGSQIKYDKVGLEIFDEPIGSQASGKPILQWVEGSFMVLHPLIIHFKEYLKGNEYDFILKNLLKTAELNKHEVDCPKTSIGHGSMGVCLMFKKLFTKTSYRKFQDAADYWFNVTNERIIPKEKNFKTFPDEVRFTGFLPGYTGIYSALKLIEQNEISLIDDLIYL